MDSIVIAHAGPPTTAHVMGDSLVGVGLGVVMVGCYLLLLRYVVARNGRRTRG